MAFNVKKCESQLLRMLTKIFIQDLRDRRILQINLTKVKLSSNFRYAQVYFITLAADVSDQKLTSLYRMLNSKLGFLQFKLATLKEYKFRQLPQLEFVYDKNIENLLQLDVLLEQN